MFERNLVIFIAFVLTAALAVPARADDAQAAAAAAAAAAAQAGAAGGTAAGAAAPPPGTSGGHFGRALSAPAVPRRTAKPGAAKASKGRRKVKRAAKIRKTESKYKSRALAERTEHTYRFNEYGEPLTGASKAKPVVNKKTRKSSPAEDEEDKPGACTTDAPCTVNNRDADAL